MSRPPLGVVALEAIEAARGRVAGVASRTPLVRLDVDAPAEIYLKLENLQPIGSFKLRGAANALATIAATDPDALAGGVYTASAGNWAQGLAYVARARGVGCRVVVPDHAPAIKLAAIERLGAAVVKVSFDAWWQVMETHRFERFEPAEGHEGRFVHPVADADVIAGAGTVGLEIVDDLPDVAAIVVPFGGGGLTSGIACGVRAVKPGTRIYAAEVATAAPLRAALDAGAPRAVAYTPSFVDGIGSKGVLPEMWPLVRDVVDGSIVVSIEAVADAVRRLVGRARVIAEGAGAASVAAALTGEAGPGPVVCVVSGGNIDPAKLAVILGGGLP